MKPRAGTAALRRWRSLALAAVATTAAMGCTIVPKHEPPPADAANAATLTVEMQPEPYDLGRERMRTFSASVFDPHACKAVRKIISMSQDGARGRWVSRDETATPSLGVAAPLEFHDDARLRTRVAAGAAIRIGLIGLRIFDEPYGAGTRVITRSCRSVVEFTPDAGATYVARFRWLPGACSGVVLRSDGAAQSAPAQTAVCRERPVAGR